MNSNENSFEYDNAIELSQTSDLNFALQEKDKEMYDLEIYQSHQDMLKEWGIVGCTKSFPTLTLPIIENLEKMFPIACKWKKFITEGRTRELS